MHSIDIRTATHADIPEIISIAREIETRKSAVSGFLKVRFSYANVACNLHTTYLVIKHKSIAGFVILDKSLAKPPVESIHISQLGVAPKFQKTGCATAMYAFIAAHCHEMTAKVAEYPVTNIASKTFHHKLGFQKIGSASHKTLAHLGEPDTYQSNILRARAATVCTAIRKWNLTT
jgi:ribosomal protein S18 acetylase RimI-like enzyme